MSNSLTAPPTGGLTTVPAWHSKVNTLTLTHRSSQGGEHSLVFEGRLADAGDGLTSEETYDLAQSVMFGLANHPEPDTVAEGSEWSGIAKAADTVTRFKAATGGPPGASPIHGASISNVESTGAHSFKGKASRYFAEAEYYNVQLLWTGNRPVDKAVDGAPQ